MGLLTEVVPPGVHLERALEIAEARGRFPRTMLADRRGVEGIGRDFKEGLALEALRLRHPQQAWRARCALRRR